MQLKRNLRFPAIAAAVLLLCLSAFPGTALAGYENPLRPGADSLIPGDEIYMGEIASIYTPESYNITWIVLPDGSLRQSQVNGAAVPMLSKFCWWDERYNPIGSPTYYPGSAVQTKLASYFSGTDAVFTTGEQRVVKDTLLPKESTNWYAGDLPGQKLFPLSIDEIGQLSAAQRIAHNIDQATPRSWFSRSSDAGHVFNYVDATGNYTNYSAQYYAIFGLRPAMYLDANAILLSGAADNSGHLPNFSVLSPATQNAWKLTLRDGKSFASGAALVSGSTELPVGYSAETLTIRHRALSAIGSEYTNVTALLTNSSGNILRYGSVNTDPGATNSTVTLPAGMTEGFYTLSLYAEDWNGAQQSDYATGTPFSVSILVGNPLRLAAQPGNRTVAIGQTATFAVAATGGSAPYRYAWARSTDGGQTWDAVGTDSPNYTTSAVTMANNGYRYRCTVTDDAANTVTSSVATLTVTQQPPIPDTGDDSTPFLFAGLVVLAGAGLAASLARGRRKRFSGD